MLNGNFFYNDHWIINAQHTKDDLKNAKKENLYIIEGDPKKNKEFWIDFCNNKDDCKKTNTQLLFF